MSTVTLITFTNGKPQGHAFTLEEIRKRWKRCGYELLLLPTESGDNVRAELCRGDEVIVEVIGWDTENAASMATSQGLREFPHVWGRWWEA